MAEANKKGLGKGLGAIFKDVETINNTRVAAPITEEDIKAETMVKLRLVEPNRDQPRKNFDEEQLQELAESIRVHGIIQPLIVSKKGERYRIIAGERRWRAAKIAGLREIPVIVKNYTDEEIAEISLIENIQRQDLDPIEEAMAYERLISEYHMTQEALSERVSKSRTVITNALRLLKLPDEVKTMLTEGTLSTGHAKVILGLSTGEKQTEAAEKILKERLSVRETEKLVKAMSAEKKAETVKEPLKNEVAYQDAEKNLTEKLGTRVRIKRRSENAGSIEISYFSLEDIERILQHIR